MLLDLPPAELADLVGLEITHANADDQSGGIGSGRLAQRAEVEGVGNALPVEPVEAVRVGRPGEQGAVPTILDLEDVAAGAVACAKAFLIGQRIENGYFQ